MSLHVQWTFPAAPTRPDLPPFPQFPGDFLVGKQRNLLERHQLAPEIYWKSWLKGKVGFRTAASVAVGEWGTHWASWHGTAHERIIPTMACGTGMSHPVAPVCS